jgi:hypothetical protein
MRKYTSSRKIPEISKAGMEEGRRAISWLAS